MSDNEEHDNESVRGLAGGCLSVELDELELTQLLPFFSSPSPASAERRTSA